MMSGDDGKGAMTVKNGLYTIQIEMTDGGQGRANGVIVLHDGKIAGGDSIFLLHRLLPRRSRQMAWRVDDHRAHEIRGRPAVVWRA